MTDLPDTLESNNAHIWLQVTPDALHKAETELEDVSFDRDLKEQFVKTMWAGAFLAAKTAGHSDGVSRVMADEKMHFERLELIEWQSAAKKKEIDAQALNRKLMSAHALFKKLNPNDT